MSLKNAAAEIETCDETPGEGKTTTCSRINPVQEGWDVLGLFILSCVQPGLIFAVPAVAP